MGTLSFALESFDDFYDSDDFAPSYPPQSLPVDGIPVDLSDITTWHLQDDIIENDVNIFCEYIDMETGDYGFGTVLRWMSNPFDLYDEDDSDDYAYIRTEHGTAYAHISNILPIHETVEVTHETSTNALPELQHATSGAIAGHARDNHTDLLELPYTARHMELAAV